MDHRRPRLLGYAAIGGWPYDEVNETTVDPCSELVLSALLGPSALFVIGTFFFLAGQVAELPVAIAAGSFCVRLWFPTRSTQIPDLHLWQRPQCVAMFGLGIVAGRNGWSVKIPGRLYRGCGYAVAVTLAAVPVLAVGLGVSNVADDAIPFLGGWRWQALALACVEASLVVAGSVWLVGLTQRRWASSGQLSARCGRSSYAAFVLQAPVLLTLATAARRVPWPAEAKPLSVAVLGVLGVPGWDRSSSTPGWVASCEAR